MNRQESEDAIKASGYMALREIISGPQWRMRQASKRLSSFHRRLYKERDEIYNQGHTLPSR